MHDRRIRIRPLLEYYKTGMPVKLQSSEGFKMRFQRTVEFASVLGHIKWQKFYTLSITRA